MPIASRNARRTYITRFLRIGDIPSLLDLERRQWTLDQSATAEDFRARIAAHPDLCVGAYCTRTGELLASVFCKPTTEAEWNQPADWARSAQLRASEPKVDDFADSIPSTRCLFGISLTSVDPGAALQLIAFNYLYGIKRGVRTVYLGSPMPGLKRYLDRNPGSSADAYARIRRAGLPLDPQLRYYHRQGWQQLVTVREDYFPHAGSLNYGAVLRADIHLAWLKPLFKLIPVSFLRSFAALAPRFAIPVAKDARGRLHLQS